MAREHARIWLDINSDDDFEALPFDAQGLYTRVILTLDDLNYCGVAHWRPKRLTTKAPDLDPDRIHVAAAHLEARRYCLFDLDTEEVLARSFIRRDELLRNPKMAAAVIKAYSGIASKPLRAAVITEIKRVRAEHPEYSSWTSKDTGPGLAKLLERATVDEVGYTPVFTDWITNRISNGIGNRITNGITNRIGNGGSVPITNRITDPVTNGITNRITNGIPSTYTSTSTPAPLEGYESREPHQAADPDEQPPSPYCVGHPNGTNRSCRACGNAKERYRDWEHRQAERAEQVRAAFWTEVLCCESCDEDGWALGEDKLPADTPHRCPLHDWEIVHARA